MLHQHHEVRVEAPLEHVWAFYCDTSRWHEWLPRGEFTDFSGPVDRTHADTTAACFRSSSDAPPWTMRLTLHTRCLLR